MSSLVPNSSAHPSIQTLAGDGNRLAWSKPQRLMQFIPNDTAPARIGSTSGPSEPVDVSRTVSSPTPTTITVQFFSGHLIFRRNRGR